MWIFGTAIFRKIFIFTKRSAVAFLSLKKTVEFFGTEIFLKKTSSLTFRSTCVFKAFRGCQLMPFPDCFFSVKKSLPYLNLKAERRLIGKRGCPVKAIDHLFQTGQFTTLLLAYFPENANSPAGALVGLCSGQAAAEG